MQKTQQDELEVQHDEKHGKFFIPFPDKQAVLRYSQDEDSVIEFKSIFVPPGLRDQGLEEKIVKEAYGFADQNNLTTTPGTVDEFLNQHADYI